VSALCTAPTAAAGMINRTEYNQKQQQEQKCQQRVQELKVDWYKITDT